MNGRVAKIKELRDITGAGVNDCKIALDVCYGDIPLATIYLKEREQAVYRRIHFEIRYKEELEKAKRRQSDESTKV